jgi:aminoglycoside 6-adenylyltransferase
LRTEKEVLSQLEHWAKENDLVRAAVFTSSRVNPERETDFLSDYDVELYVSDLQPFKRNDDWLRVFGHVLICWPYKPHSTNFGENFITRLVLFTDCVRIDFQITDKTDIKPDNYDDGYKILVDKDNITASLNQPTFQKDNI